MKTPLLQTKLYVPPPRPDLVPRPRLIERLNEGLRRKLTLVSAPAGFGKTTLASHWLNDLPGTTFETETRPIKHRQSNIENRAAWLSLDESDNDPGRFLTYLVAALQTVEPDLGRTALAALQSPRSPPIEYLLTDLLNQLAALPGRIILILDDCHLIDNQEIHRALTFLLEHLAARLHLLILTRADPPLPLARLRAREELTELRARDLRFTPEEVTAFLNEVRKLELLPEEISALDARTEGWIAGLQMAALSMQGRQDVAGFIKAFSGSHRFILDYLVEEVLDRQPPDVRGFLLQTSILERLTAPLCDALAGRDDSQTFLNHLERANLFLVPLDNARRWYRYHHLFADLLRSRLEQTQPDSVAALHRRAADWFEQNDLMTPTINHALAAGDLERAARLVEQNCLAIITRGELSSILNQVNALPAELTRNRPWLHIYQAWGLTFAGHLDRVEPLLQEVEQRLQGEALTDENRDMLGNIAGMRAFIADMSGDVSRALELARRADELFPKKNLKNLLVRSVVPFTLGRAYRLEGDLDKAGQALTEVAEIGRAADNIWTISVAMYELAVVRRIQGRLQGAAEIFRETLQLITDRGGSEFGTVAKIDAGLSDLLRECNDLAAARRHALLSIEHMRLWQSPGDLVIAYLALARVLQAQGELESASDTLRKAEQIKGKYLLFPPLGSMVETGRVSLWLAQGNLAAARRWVQDSKPGERGPLLCRELERIALARVRLAQGQPAEALELLRRLAESAEAGGRGGRLVEILALLAIALQAQGEVSQALAVLARALALAEPEGFVRTFIDEGEPVARLLAQLPASPYRDKLLAALAAEAGDAGPKPDLARPSPVDQPAALVEPLSERERQVLRLLMTDLSVPEIAAELVVATSTVRSHVKSLYGKLNVHSRYEAVTRARELNLL